MKEVLIAWNEEIILEKNKENVVTEIFYKSRLFEKWKLKTKAS